MDDGPDLSSTKSHTCQPDYPSQTLSHLIFPNQNFSIVFTAAPPEHPYSFEFLRSSLCVMTLRAFVGHKTPEQPSQLRRNNSGWLRRVVHVGLVAEIAFQILAPFPCADSHFVARAVRYQAPPTHPFTLCADLKRNHPSKKYTKSRIFHIDRFRYSSRTRCIVSHSKSALQTA